MESRDGAGKGEAASQPRSLRRGRMPVGRERKWAETDAPEGLSEKTGKEGLTGVMLRGSLL